MRIDHAVPSLRDHLSKMGLSTDGEDVQAVASAMMDWYADVRAEDATPIEEDGDMLLFQWGVFDWGTGPSFEYDLTRQLVRSDNPEDEGIIQVSLTHHYPVTPETEALGKGHRWCGSPDELPEFRRFVEGHPASLAVQNRTVTKFMLDAGVAG